MTTTIPDSSASMLDEVVLLDGDGRPCGTANRREVHGADTPLHLAFSLHLVDERGRTLLTRRATSKLTWPGTWTNSCCGHPRPGEDMTAAVRRRVHEELGVRLDDIELVLPDFRYRAVDASGVVEHEICPVHVARVPSDLVLDLDPDEVEEWAWVPWAELHRTARRTPSLLSPWAVEQVLEIGPDLPTPADASRAVSKATASPTADDTLAAVERLLTERLDRIAGEWHREDASVDVVLGDHDVPELLASLVQSGGKRIRPLMCHWGWIASGAAVRGEAPGTMHQVGAALELLHAFGLAQDDVMDGSRLRRGLPAVHVRAAEHHRRAGGTDDPDRYGESVAVLVGDLAHAEADALVAELPQAVRRLWWRTSVELVRGQARDLSGAALAGGLDAVERATEVAHAKSGAYTVQRPLLLGATLGDAPPAVIEVLTAYGRHLGEAFALRDDLLGVFGDPEVTGKPASDDLRAAKATVLLALAEQRCTGAAAAAVARMRTHTHDDADVDVVHEAMIESGVRAEAERRVVRAVEDAVACLEPHLIDPVAAEGLSAVATNVAWRNR